MTDKRHSGDERTSTASEKKFETIFEHANDAIFIVDVEQDRIVDCNPAAESLVEYSREELLSMPASELHPHNLDQFLDFTDTVLEQGYGWTDDITCYCKSGDIIPAEMSASVIELDGRSHVVNHIRETSDRAERDWFEALLEHSSDLITVVTNDGTVRYQSDSIDNVLGYTPGELRDSNYFDYLHPDDEPAVRTAFERLVEGTGDTVERREYRFRRADGTWAWLEGVASFRSDSPISGYVINARDVTARKETRQQAAVLNRVLRHNLRNDLNVIRGRAEILTDTDSETVVSNAETVVSNADDLLALTSYTGDIADMIETHHVPQYRQDVARLLEREVATLREAHPETTVTLDTPPECSVVTAPKLDLALHHVLTNAAEHNDADSPRVTVDVREPASSGDYVEIVVADNGPGIPTQEKTVLLEGKEGPLEHGSGLGLWIVNWIVNRSGGNLYFDENKPRGSRVTLALPPAD
jgi:PAS domain S-box-containing protein